MRRLSLCQCVRRIPAMNAHLPVRPILERTVTGIRLFCSLLRNCRHVSYLLLPFRLEHHVAQRLRPPHMQGNRRRCTAVSFRALLRRRGRDLDGQRLPGVGETDDSEAEFLTPLGDLLHRRTVVEGIRQCLTRNVVGRRETAEPRLQRGTQWLAYSARWLLVLFGNCAERDAMSDRICFSASRLRSFAVAMRRGRHDPTPP